MQLCIDEHVNVWVYRAMKGYCDLLFNAENCSNIYGHGAHPSETKPGKESVNQRYI